MDVIWGFGVNKRATLAQEVSTVSPQSSCLVGELDVPPLEQPSTSRWSSRGGERLPNV